MRLRKRGDTYQAIYYDQHGRRVFRSTRCSDRRAAEAAARRFEREAQDPDHAAASSVTLSEILGDLLDERQAQADAGKKSAATVAFYRKYAGHWRRQLEVDEDGSDAPFLVARFTAGVVDRCIAQRRAEGAEETTIAKQLVCLRAALKLAKRAGKWKGDIGEILPVAFAPEYKPGERSLTPLELRALLPHLTADHAARVCFEIATSANLGETFHAQRADVGDAMVAIRGTKRATRRRHVPVVTGWQRELLAFALEHARGEGGKLFRYDGGFHSALRQACVDAKIPNASSNDLRRTFCAWMRADGVPAELVAPAMGHADTKMVERIYGRMPPETLAARMHLALGTPVAQTGSDRVDSLDGRRSRRRRQPRKKAEKMSTEGGARTLTPLPAGDFKSALPELPTPRDRKKNSPVYDRGGTRVAQHDAPPVAPARRRLS